jgi:hypothetical protein
MHGKCNIVKKSTDLVSVLFVMMRTYVDNNRLKIFTIVTVKLGVFLDAVSGALVEKCPRFRGFYCFIYQAATVFVITVD